MSDSSAQLKSLTFNEQTAQLKGYIHTYNQGAKRNTTLRNAADSGLSGVFSGTSATHAGTTYGGLLKQGGLAQPSNSLASPMKEGRGVVNNTPPSASMAIFSNDMILAARTQQN